MSPCMALTRRPTLVVVDLQAEPLCETGWFGRLPLIVEGYSHAAAEIIRQKYQQGYQVAFMELDDCGPTEEIFREAARGAAEIVTVGKSGEDPFDPSDPRSQNNREIFAPLAESRIPVEFIGMNAGACVPMAVRGFLAMGCECQVLAHGILNHYVQLPLDEAEYRIDNDVARLRQIYRDLFGGNDAILDLSALSGDTNLVDAHLRLHAKRSMMEFA
jgi:hypothetical protein